MKSFASGVLLHPTNVRTLLLELTWLYLVYSNLKTHGAWPLSSAYFDGFELYIDLVPICCFLFTHNTSTQNVHHPALDINRYFECQFEGDLNVNLICSKNYVL